MVERRQGGNSWFHIGRQPDEDTLISDIANMSQFRRQFTNFGLDMDSERLRSEAVRGTVDASKSQSGPLWGAGPIGTEIYTSSMLDYVQAILNGDPATASSAVATTTVYDGETTPKGEAAGTTVVTTSGDSPDLAITQPITPGRLMIILDGAEGPVTVVGQRKVGLGSLDSLPMTETVELDGTDHNAVTENYFHRIDRLEYSNAGLTVDTAADLDIVSDSKLKKTAFSARDLIFPGWTVQGNVGGVPRLGYGVVPVSARLDVGNNIRLLMETQARAVWRKRTVEGGVFTEKLSDDSALAENPFIPNVFFPYYGGYMEIDDSPTIFKGFQLNVNQGLDFLEGSTGSRSRLPLERGDAGRDIQASFNIYYESGDAATDDFISWDERFRDNITSKLVMYSYYWTDTGKEYYHKVTLDEVELTAVPRVGVENKGALEENLSVQAIREGATAAITWEVVDDAGWVAA